MSDPAESQLDIFDEAEARRLRDEGIRTSFEHAEAVEPDWGKSAYAVLLQFVAQSSVDTFMAEDVRAWSSGRLAEPPHKRAWGHVILGAAKAGIILKIGYSRCKDPRTHQTPATLWKVNR